ncbi:MAG: deoxyribose-phosphate aldolase [Desulfobacterales bacterium]
MSAKWNRRTLAAVIDHTLLKPEATSSQVREVCSEARKLGFASVCVNPCHVSTAVHKLRDTPVKVCSVIGFPLGANRSIIKAAETLQAVSEGADEIDMVMAVGALKEKRHDQVEAEIRSVVEAAGHATVKVIIETCCLTDDEKVTACQLAARAGAAFVKTSTGFGSAGATAADVRLMRSTVGNALGVKASGGIRTLDQALEMLAAGATRLGTSAGVAILEELRA